MSDKKLKLMIPLICIVMIGLVFFMSSDSYSDIRTLNFSVTIYEMLPKGIQSTFGSMGIDIKAIDYIIRKCSHFIEYMVVSMLLFKISLIYKIKPKASIIYILFLCLLLANLDEFYQSFVPGRNSSVKDCLIDFLGSITGIIIYLIFIKLHNHKSKL